MLTIVFELRTLSGLPARPQPTAAKGALEAAEVVIANVDRGSPGMDALKSSAVVAPYVVPKAAVGVEARAFAIGVPGTVDADGSGGGSTIEG